MILRLAYWWFLCDVTSLQNSLNSRYYFLDSRNGYSTVKLPIFGEGKFCFKISKTKESLYEVACHLTWLPHTKLLKILTFFNYSYFTKIVTRKPKIGYFHFWSQKKWYLLFKGFLWWCDVTWKPSNYKEIAESLVYLPSVRPSPENATIFACLGGSYASFLWSSRLTWTSPPLDSRSNSRGISLN